MRPRRVPRAVSLALVLFACAGDSTSPTFDTTTGVLRSGDIDLAYALDVPRGQGPFPAVVLVHGSGRVTKEEQAFFAAQFVERGFAVLRYDKRGVGGSGGPYSGVGIETSPVMIPLLAGDAAAALRFLAARRGVDASRVGLAGASQAGWIIPVAATLEPETDFAVIISGPTVSVGIEIFYSSLAEETTTPQDELSARLAEYPGPHGFDPLSHLRQLRIPVIWLYGGRDRSIPTPECLTRLQSLIADQGKPFTVRVYPLAGHDLAGSVWPDVSVWLEATVRAPRGSLTR